MLLGYNQRWYKPQYITSSAVNNSPLAQAVINNIPARLGQLHAQNQAHAPHFLNQGRILSLHSLQTRLHIISNFYYMLQETWLTYNVQYHICCGTGQWIAAKGRAVISWVEGCCYLVSSNKGTDRYTASQTLGQRYHIRLNAEVFISKELAASAHTALDFVKNQNSIVLVAKLTYLLHICHIRNMDTALTLNRLQHNSSSLVTHKLFQSFNIIIRHIIKASWQWSKSLMIFWLSGSSQSSNSTAVEAVNGRDNLRFISINAVSIFTGNLNSTLIGLRTGITKEHLAQTAKLYQFFCCISLHLGVIQIGAMNHFASLVCHSLNQFLVIMSQHIYRNTAQKINIFIALSIIYIYTITMIQDYFVAGKHRQIILGILGIYLFIS